MNYFLDTSCLAETFALPRKAVDNYLKITTGTQLKVLLYIMRDISKQIDIQSISSAIGVSAEETEDALLFWVQCGILKGENPVKEESGKKVAVRKAQKPTRVDVAVRGNEDPKIMMLLREAQLKFARALKTNESATLVWLYDDEGMDVSVILILLEYAVSEKKCNISFIEKTAVKWLEKGVETVTDAEKIIKEEATKKLAWNVVASAFGIERRIPSEKEAEFSSLWVNDYGMSQKMLKAAYDACVNSKTKLSFPYVATIIEAWHKKGYEKPEDIKNEPIETKKAKKENKNDFAAYNLELFESMLNSDD